MTSLVQAEIIISEQPKDLYNIGDVATIPIKITTNRDIEQFFSIRLLCLGKETEVRKEYLVMQAGGEKKITSAIPLTKEFIGNPGTCKIKTIFGGEFALTEDFQISNLIHVTIGTNKKDFSPKETLLVSGEAIKENNQNVKNGFVELKIVYDETAEETIILETVNEGYYEVNYTIPEDMKAGKYRVRADIYEKNTAGEKTNTGFAENNIVVKQIPKSLEIYLEDETIIPGTDLKVKAILHDQSGQSMASTAILTIKDSSGKIQLQEERKTEEVLNFHIPYNEKASEWIIYAVSNKIDSERTFEITEKQDIEIELLNSTVLITNKGNTFYNKTLVIKIGNQTKNLETNLKVDESKKYTLTAPEGEYNVVIEVEGGGEKTSGNVLLTGKAIDIKENSGKILSVITHPFVWIFMILILGFIAIMVIKKGYKKSFIGRSHLKKNSTEKPKINAKEKKSDEKSLIQTEEKAALSLSLKGEKHDAAFVCLDLKNYDDFKNKKESVGETTKKLASLAREEKALIYESGKNIFFIIAPIKTRTFKNEKSAVELANKIKETIDKHNKLFKQKIEFGISIGKGPIVSKKAKEGLEFMSMNNLLSNLKKIAASADKEVLLTEEIKNSLGSNIKTERKTINNKDFYKITEIREREDHSKFISSFLDRVHKDEKNKNN
ncbi:hypothetical protein K9L16_00020 [Candidatus Pacearchaeota archaeon]|nr:hypothetical protein [Candidatus Pacearchaeota archaeon]